MSTPSAPGIITAGQNAFQLSQSGAEQTQLAGPMDTAPRAGAALNTPAPSPDANGGSAWQWILAFSVLGFLVWVLNKSRIMHAIFYYLLVLATISTLLINYRWLASALAPLSGVAGSLQQAGSDLAGAATGGKAK